MKKKKNNILIKSYDNRYDLTNYKFLNCNYLITIESFSLLVKENKYFADWRYEGYYLVRKIFSKKIKLDLKKIKVPKYKTLVFKKKKFRNKKWIFIPKKIRRKRWRVYRNVKVAFNKYIWSTWQELNFFDKALPLEEQFNDFNKKFRYYFIHINLTYNNINVLVANQSGEIQYWATAGLKRFKFKGSKKRTISALKTVARQASFWLTDNKVDNIKIVYKGNRKSMRLKAILQLFQDSDENNRYKILALFDMNSISYNGCKKAKKRR